MSKPASLCLLTAALALSACVGDSDLVAESANPIEEGSPEAIGLIDFLNQTTLVELDDEVPLEARAAANLMAFRAGDDAILGSDDDQRFTTVAEVDSVPRVGPKTLETLLGYVIAQGWVAQPDDLLGSFDGVPFTYAEAERALALVNSASEATLRQEVPLVSQAVTSILAARPIADMETLASLYYVGTAMLTRIKAFTAIGREVGLISDLDKTVIPPSSEGLPEAPYPGVATLYQELEHRSGGSAGDVHYVTARSPENVTEIPEWLATHGVPAGSIDTGTSGMPWVARPEKVSDITRIMEANPDQRFLLIGDTSHVDPDVYGDIMDLYPDRVIAAFVHHINNINDERAAGLHIFEDYAEVAAILLAMGELDVSAARAVMEAAQAEGLEITDTEIDALIDSHLP